MKHFLVTFHSADDYGTEDRLGIILAERYRLLMRDTSAGLFFIATGDTEETATMILDRVTSDLEDESPFTLYVIEMGKTWDAATMEPEAAIELERHLSRE